MVNKVIGWSTSRYGSVQVGYDRTDNFRLRRVKWVQP